MRYVFLSILFIYLVGYFACIFSWFFSEEGKGYIRENRVTERDIIIDSLNWVTILYNSVRDTYK